MEAKLESSGQAVMTWNSFNLAFRSELPAGCRNAFCELATTAPEAQVLQPAMQTLSPSGILLFGALP